jgi:hypothetical protein
VVFEIGYYQVTTEVMKLVTASMKLSEFDNNVDDTEYMLMLSFNALGWMDLMNRFQLPYHVYCILYCVIGAGAVSFTFVAWFYFRIITRRAQAPPFRFGECYEFMLWWPIQGVTTASIPVLVLWFVIKIMLGPSIDVTAAIPCTYEDVNTGMLDPTDRCRNGRTGTCFLIGGVLLMISASKLIVPQLRKVEEEWLLQQPRQLLHAEGLPILPEKRHLIRAVPIRWKRAHLVFVSMLLVLPLMMMWEFTYNNFFGEKAVLFIV